MTIQTPPAIESIPPAPQELPAEEQLPQDQPLLFQPRQVQEGSFWRKPWVISVLPLSTSLALHLGLIIMALALFKPVARVFEVVREQVIIPDATLADSGPPGGIEHPGIGADPTRGAAQDLSRDVQDSAGWSAKASNELNQAIMGDAGNSESSAITVGPKTAIGHNGIGGDGSDSAGQLAIYGVPGGGSAPWRPRARAAIWRSAGRIRGAFRRRTRDRAWRRWHRRR